MNSVFMQPELRGRRYAQACVAATSHRALERGKEFCTLYADLANPVSNRVYVAIGYRPVTDLVDFAFAS